MIPYIIIIAISTALVYASIKIEEKTDNKLIIYIARAVAILFPAIIAGIRYNVGTDNVGTYKKFFDEIVSGEITYRLREFEIGYVLLNKLIIWLGGNYNVLMFTASLITITPIYFGLLHYKEKISVPLGFFMFMVIFYQKSFNLVRQMMSVAIIFFGFTYLDFKEEGKEHKKYIIIQCIKYIACVLIAGLFQRTSLIMLIIPFVKEMYANPKYKFLSIASYVVLIAIILNFEFIGQIMAKSEKLYYYSMYFDKEGDAQLSIAYFIRIIPVIIPFFFVMKKITKEKQMNLLYSMTVIGCILLLLGYLTSTWGERISYYFSIFQIVMFPYFIRCLKNNKFLYIASTVLIIAFNLAIWYYDYIYKGRDETVPYKTIFGINRNVEQEENNLVNNYEINMVEKVE